MNNNEVKEKKYPLQTCKIKRTSKTLGVDFYLFAPTEEDNSCSPLELHNGFSRFLFTIVDKSNPSVNVTPRANIPSGDIACIKLKTELAMQAYFLGGNTDSNSNEENDFKSRPAFTQKLLFGNGKGKTPAEILIANPQEKDNLLQTRAWLLPNVDKYPANKLQIEAIDDAIALLEIGELQESSAPPSGVIVRPIYKTEYKHMSQKNEQGNTLVYSISIMFDSSKNYPFTIEITNCFAPIEILPSGQHRPVMNKATHAVKSSIALTDNEWVDMIYHLTDVKQYFELTNFKPLWGIAQKYSYSYK